MNRVEQVVYDLKEGFKVIKGWNASDWKRAAPVLIFFLFIIVWFVVYNVYTVQQAKDRPLYQTAISNKLSSPQLPSLVSPDEVSSSPSSFISDDDYRFFADELRGIANKLAKRDEVADPIIQESITALDMILPGDIGDGVVAESLIQTVEGNTAMGILSIAYGEADSEISLTWTVTFGREDTDDNWSLESLVQDSDTALL